MLSAKSIKMLVFALLIITIVSFIIAGVVMIFFGFDSSSKNKIDIEKNFEAKGLKSVFIETASSDVNIIPEESDTIKIHLYGTSSKKAVPDLITDLVSNNLQIKVKDKFVLNIGLNLGISQTKLDIYLPKAFIGKLVITTASGSLKMDFINSKALLFKSASGEAEIKNFSGNLEISNASGNIKLDELKTDKLNVRNVSGSVLIKNLSSRDSQVKTNSGMIEIKNASGNFEIRSDSGTVKLDTIDSDKIIVKTISGSFEGDTLTFKDTVYGTASGTMNVKNFTGNIEFNSTSGTLNAEYNIFDNNIKASSVSGSINIKIPDISRFNLRFKSVSGVFDSDFKYNVSSSNKNNNFDGSVGESKNSIEINTTSGQAKILKID